LAHFKFNIGSSWIQLWWVTNRQWYLSKLVASGCKLVASKGVTLLLLVLHAVSHCPRLQNQFLELFINVKIDIVVIIVFLWNKGSSLLSSNLYQWTWQVSCNKLHILIKRLTKSHINYDVENKHWHWKPWRNRICLDLSETSIVSILTLCLCLFFCWYLFRCWTFCSCPFKLWHIRCSFCICLLMQNIKR